MKNLGYGKGYEKYTEDDLLPEKLKGKKYLKKVRTACVSGWVLIKMRECGLPGMRGYIANGSNPALCDSALRTPHSAFRVSSEPARSREVGPTRLQI